MKGAFKLRRNAESVHLYKVRVVFICLPHKT